MPEKLQTEPIKVHEHNKYRGRQRQQESVVVVASDQIESIHASQRQNFGQKLPRKELIIPGTFNGFSNRGSSQC